MKWECKKARWQTYNAKCRKGEKNACTKEAIGRRNTSHTTWENLRKRFENNKAWYDGGMKLRYQQTSKSNT